MNQTTRSPERSFRIRPDSRVCIIGAGPAGLSAACTLKDRGCRHITILEREAHPGGKCLSQECGDCILELGAVFACDAYETTLDLMGRVGMTPARKQKRKKEADKGRPSSQPQSGGTGHGTGSNRSGAAAPRAGHKGGTRSERRMLIEGLMEKGYYPMNRVFPGYFSVPEAARLLLQILRYRRLSRKHGRLGKPGLDGLPGDLHQPFSAWVDKHGMREFAKMIEIPCTTFGYGYFEEIPAAYVLKYMNVPFVFSMIFQKRLFHWEEGVQTLWKRLASGFDVRYRTAPIKILRGDGVSVQTGNETLEYDALILTAPLDEALDYLDARTEERDLFSRIKTYDYYVFCLEISGLPIAHGFRPANFRKDRAGRMMIWSRRSKSQGLHTFYTLGGPALTEEGIRANLEEEIAEMGGRLLGVRAVKRWKYFPHVDPGTMAADFYERLEGLQGKFRTLYAGELMNFSTIEHSAGYARDLVGRFF
jgi:oxygen-dependent protoporphyrinogen oxidase